MCFQMKFSHWSPPLSIPEPWLFDKRLSPKKDFSPTTTSNVSVLVRVTDDVCPVTGENDRLDSARLVPVLEAESYATDKFNFTVNSPNNQFALRADLNGRGLESGHFCFFPYKQKWVIIWIGNGSLQLAKTHNLSEIRLPPRLRAAYLFARFAFNIFLLADAYLGPQANHLKFVEYEEGSTYVDEGEERKGNENAEEDEEQSGADKPKRRSRQYTGGGRGGGGGGAGASRPALERMYPRRRPAAKDKAAGRKRPAVEQLIGQATKKYQSHNDIPDISPVDPGALRKMAQIDRLLEAGELPYDDSTEWYPGYSRAEELAYNYKRAHPATTDPGGARIALVSEREED
ncbi:hypothetical protein B0H19DRAFT_1057662 [Mycena capillaripes]|nr:hypothetical protein B0H19DRAFT_1057662 [Mycena capillaripes]